MSHKYNDTSQLYQSLPRCARSKIRTPGPDFPRGPQYRQKGPPETFVWIITYYLHMSLQNYQQSVITRTHTYERNDEMKDDEDVQ